MGSTTAAAAQYLQEKYGINFLPKKALAELEAQQLNLSMKQEIYDCTHSYMCNALADPTGSDYRTAKAGTEWLISSRKVPRDVLHSLPIGIIPELTRLQSIMGERYKKKMKIWRDRPEGKPEPPNHIESAFDYLKNFIRDADYAGAICFPLHITPKEIGRLKFRAPNNDAVKKITMPDDDFENLLGLFGLGWDMYYNFTDPGSNLDFAYLTEGEMDVLSLMARFSEQGNAKYPIFSVGGTGGSNHIEPILSSCGFSKVFLVGDAPHEHGNEVVASWLEKLQKLDARIFAGWNNLLGYKDLDEAVVLGGEENVSDVLQKQFKQNFIFPWAWAMSRAEIELDSIPAEDFRGLITKAAEHGKYLRHTLECEAYVRAISAKYNLNPSLLKREIASREDNENGFIMRCSDALKDLLYVVGTESVAGTRYLVFFDKKNKRYCKIKIDNDQSAAQELSPIIGTMCDFINEFVGYPTFLQNPATAAPEAIIRKRLDGQLRFYVKEAIQILARGVTDMSTTLKRRQGYHIVTLPDSKQKLEYVVCGADVFAINRDGRNVRYEKLDGPIDHGIIFELNSSVSEGISEPWYPGGLSVEKLEAGKDVNLRELYDNLVKFYDTGFNFKHQKVTAQLLAGLAMVFPIMDAFERPIMLFVTGDSSSGKSYLVSTFAGPSNDQIRLFWGSTAWTDYSAARVSQYCNRSSHLICLDEFEPDQTEPGKAEKIREILSMLRGLITGEARRARYRSNGEGGDSRMRMPVIFTAIQGAERTADLNRLIVVEMKKVMYRTEPVNSIFSVFKPEQVAEMSLAINTAMYAHADKLSALEKEMRNDFARIQTLLSVKMEWRYLSSLFSILALLKYIGINWEQFIIEFVEANEPTITRATTVSESDQYLNRIMHTPALYQRETGQNASIAQLLVIPDRRHEVNSTACGVYFNAESGLLVMLLDQVLPRLLSNDMRTGMTALKLRTLLERNPTALSVQQIEDSHILRKVGPSLGAGIRVEDIVVFHADRWLTSIPVEELTEPNDPLKAEEPTNAETENPQTKNSADFNW